MTGNMPARAFLSYTRADNADYLGVVDRLSSELAGRFEATTGRPLEVFVDRDAIGWGEEWRTAIRESVRAATFFLPVITMRYFRSDACREELLAFHENAKQLGVTELLMPIVLAGSEGITAEDDRPEVQLIESLNYKNIQSAWLAGYESPEWRQSIDWMVNQLATAIRDAEDELDSRAAGPKGALEPTEGRPGDLVALTTGFDDLKPLIEAVMSDMVSFGEAAQGSINGQNFKGLPTNEQRAKFLGIARALTEPSSKLMRSATALEVRATETDAELRAIVEELRTIDATAAEEQVESLKSTMSGMQELKGVVAQMNEFVQMMRFAAVADVGLRKALEPAIKGITSVSNSLEVFDAWRSL